MKLLTTIGALALVPMTSMAFTVKKTNVTSLKSEIENYSFISMYGDVSGGCHVWYAPTENKADDIRFEVDTNCLYVKKNLCGGELVVDNDTMYCTKVTKPY